MTDPELSPDPDLVSVSVTTSKPKQKQKRNRLTLNCFNCKRRKIKCDRQSPCQQCLKSRLACAYQRPDWENTTNSNSNNSNNSNSNSNSNNKKRDINDSNIMNLGVPDQYIQNMYQAELQELKDRIRDLEASQQTIKRTKIHSPVTSISQIKLYKYDPENNPTFVGINPYPNENETFNFYAGYSSVYVTAVSRRYNSGPFSWLSIMKKDPGLINAWKYIKAQRAEHISHLKKVARDANEPDCVLDMNNPSHTHVKTELDESDPKPKSEPLKQKVDEEFHAMVMDRDGFNDFRSYGKIKKTSKSSKNNNNNKNNNSTKNSTKNDNNNNNNLKNTKVDSSDESLSNIVSMNKHGISLGLTVYEGTIDKELQLIEKISMVVPKQKVVWTLINKFFAKIYPFMPIIDEQDFKKEISRMLGPEGYDEVSVDVTVEKRLDFAYLGILLVILRITYLSLFSNRNCVNENNLNTTDPSPKAQELKYLLSNPVNITIVNMAQECLEQFDFMRRTNFIVLQCAFVLKLYRMFAPEDGDGADEGDSQTYNAMLIQMAYSMGLNREPSNNSNEDLPDDLKTNNIQRKIWNYLIVSDLSQAYRYGNPLNIDRKYYDTTLPHYIEGNENIEDVEMEKHIVGMFPYFEKYFNMLHDMLDITLDIKGQIQISELTSQISEFEIFLHSNFGVLKTFLVPFDEKVYDYSFIKIMICRNYINAKLFLNTIFYHLFLHYEKQQNTEFAYFYLKKILACQIGEFFPSIFHLIGDNHINFGDVADLMLNPTIETMIHRSTDLNFAILIRLNSSIYQMKHDPNHHEKLLSNHTYRLKLAKLTQAALHLRKVCDYFVAAMSKLSQRYFHAWRITKAHTFVLKCISNDEFYAVQDPVTTFLDLSDEQLTEFTNLIGSNLHENCIKRKPLYKHIKKEIDRVSNIRETSQSEFAPTPTTTPIQTPIQPQTESEIHTPTPLQTSTNVFSSPSDIMKVQSVVDNSLASGSVKSGAFLDDFDWEKGFNIVNNPDIDNLWLQMVQMRNNSSTDSMNNHNNNNNNNNNNQNNNQNSMNNSDMNYSTVSSLSVNGENPMTPSSILNYNSNVDQYKQDANRLLREFEIFDTLPFERYFGSGRGI